MDWCGLNVTAQSPGRQIAIAAMSLGHAPPAATRSETALEDDVI